MKSLAAVVEKMFGKERDRGKTAWIRETRHLSCGIEPGGLEIHYSVHVEADFVLAGFYWASSISFSTLAFMVCNVPAFWRQLPKSVPQPLAQ